MHHEGVPRSELGQDFGPDRAVGDPAPLLLHDPVTPGADQGLALNLVVLILGAHTGIAHVHGRPPELGELVADILTYFLML
jgi:hypothetical protein